MEVARKFSPSFYDGPVLQRRHGLLRVNELDPSGVTLPLFSNVAFLPPISGPPLPISLSWQLLLLFLLNALLILAPPVGRGDGQPLGGSRLIPPHIAHHPNQRHWECY